MMDKIKPILAYQFWILLGVASLLIIIGWWMGTGSMVAAIDTRMSKLNALNVPPGTGTPNNDWIEGLDKTAQLQEKRLILAGADLWEQQKEAMVWPRDIAGTMDKLKWDDEIIPNARELYRSGFPVEKEAVQQIVEPYDPFTGEGKVLFPIERLPLVDGSIWDILPPTSKEIWRIQEDIWLLSSLLRSVRDFNNEFGGDTLRKVPLKEIRTIKLLGGDLTKRTTSDAAEQGGPGGGGFSGEEFGGGFGGGYSGRGLQNRVNTVSGFNLAEEFGAIEVEQEPLSGFEDPADPNSNAYGVQKSALPPGPRYVTEDADVPFKTRGFYMQIVVDHRYLPEFLVELTHCEFPVRILRVQQVDLNGSAFEMAGNNSGPRRRSFGNRSNPGAGGAGDAAFNAVLLDPFLAEVSIAGLMTIYRPPTAEEIAALEKLSEPGDAETAALIEEVKAELPPGEGTEAEGAVPTDGGQPATPADGTEPAAGAAASPGEEVPSTAPATNGSAATSDPASLPPTESPEPAATTPAGT
ncbi:hypothetical protein [Calycomorphotria hydatis]|uniref:Uncharacterized protein n=1 Tax=Calycomorphotria hydatis TaxID=2528027 RepID=A0A517T6X1_9PLAN|nr:hypothetical protein [Calycomorphotria hydatis]QDT64124.1 hypothetical protein V22_13550 [Calycomorphotria hydatis]